MVHLGFTPKRTATGVAASCKAGCAGHAVQARLAPRAGRAVASTADRWGTFRPTVTSTRYAWPR